MDDVERIERALRTSPYEGVRTVEVSLDGDKVVLTGTVRSFYVKQLAQETLRPLGRKIVNELTVVGDG